MTELSVQRYLREFNKPTKALESLKNEYGIRTQQENNLVLLNYDFISKQSEISDDCRALILEFGSWNRVSLSFRRFYNYGDGKAANIDWYTARVYEKLDGSLIVTYHDGRQWQVQTRGNIYAMGNIQGYDFTFRDRVLNITGDLNSLMENVPTNLCLVCEYVGPYNRIVTYYPEEKLYLLTVRDKNDLWDFGPDLDHSVFHKPKCYNFNNINEVVQSVKELPKLDEGYVVVDHHSNRVKVKNPSYLALHNALGGEEKVTDKNFASLAIQGDTDDIKINFPEFKESIEYWESIVEDAINSAEWQWQLNRTQPDKKSFALNIKDEVLSAWLFQKWDQKTELSAREWIKTNMRPEKLINATKPKTK